MNDYEISAGIYRDILKDEILPEEARRKIEKKITALNFMAAADRETQQELFNTGAFNTILKGYVLMALDFTGADIDHKKAIMRQIEYALDTATADQAEAYYVTH